MAHRPDPAALVSDLGWPRFVKPANMGSSIGVSRITGPDDLVGAVEQAFRYDHVVLVEEGVTARELLCGVLGDAEHPEASVVTEVKVGGGFSDYAQKYLSMADTVTCPADLPNDTAAQVREMSLRAFRAVGGYGLARVDFLYDETAGRLYVFTYFVRRLLGAVVMLLLISLVTFGIFFWLPKLAGQTTDQIARAYVGRGASTEAIEATKDRLGLDDPVIVQYGNYVKTIVEARTTTPAPSPNTARRHASATRSGAAARCWRRSSTGHRPPRPSQWARRSSGSRAASAPGWCRRCARARSGTGPPWSWR